MNSPLWTAPNRFSTLAKFPPRNLRVLKRTAASLIYEGDLGGGFAKLLARYWDIKRGSRGRKKWHEPPSTPPAKHIRAESGTYSFSPKSRFYQWVDFGHFLTEPPHMNILPKYGCKRRFKKTTALPLYKYAQSKREFRTLKRFNPPTITQCESIPTFISTTPPRMDSFRKCGCEMWGFSKKAPNQKREF